MSILKKEGEAQQLEGGWGMMSFFLNSEPTRGGGWWFIILFASYSIQYIHSTICRPSDRPVGRADIRTQDELSHDRDTDR